MIGPLPNPPPCREREHLLEIYKSLELAFAFSCNSYFQASAPSPGTGEGWGGLA